MRLYSKSKRKSREPEYIHPQDWCLHHRGADDATIREIVEVLATKEQRVEVSAENGAALSHEGFRNAIRASITRGHTRFLILLTTDFSGHAFQQTLWHLTQEFGASVSFVPVRVEPCELGKLPYLSCDLARLDDPAERKAAILRLAPKDPEISRSCGLEL